ncbi:hypothetical protein HDK77DRAFT_15272 [Phyllosticta capitalensis]
MGLFDFVFTRQVVSQHRRCHGSSEHLVGLPPACHWYLPSLVAASPAESAVAGKVGWAGQTGSLVSLYQEHRWSSKPQNLGGQRALPKRAQLIGRWILRLGSKYLFGRESSSCCLYSSRPGGIDGDREEVVGVDGRADGLGRAERMYMEYMNLPGSWHAVRLFAHATSEPRKGAVRPSVRGRSLVFLQAIAGKLVELYRYLRLCTYCPLASIRQQSVGRYSRYAGPYQQGLLSLKFLNSRDTSPLRRQHSNLTSHTHPNIKHPPTLEENVRDAVSQSFVARARPPHLLAFPTPQFPHCRMDTYCTAGYMHNQPKKPLDSPLPLYTLAERSSSDMCSTISKAKGSFRCQAEDGRLHPSHIMQDAAQGKKGQVGVNCTPRRRRR